MDAPFIYNRPVSGRNFVGRKTEVPILANLLRDGENVVMYEPPKTGKDSILQQVFYDMKLSGIQSNIASLTLRGVRSLEDFCLKLGSALIKPYGASPDDYSRIVAENLTMTHFVFDPQAYEETGRILSLGWDLGDEDVRAVAALPYKLARRNGRKLYVCIDEFQDVMLTGEGERICGIMQEVFKARGSEDRACACYILYGSRVNAMKEIFERRKFFHRQVERVELGSIDAKDLADSVNRGFLSSGKVIDRELLMGACELFKCNPYYVNFFASVCDSLSKGYIMEPVLMEALSDMLAVYEPQYRAMMADLTTYQAGLLHAVVDGYSRFSSSEVIRRYGLNSSANVLRLKEALCKKEIIVFDAEDVPHIIDPLFEYWVTKYYFDTKSI